MLSATTRVKSANLNLSPKFDASAATAEVGRAVAHDSAERHVCGSAPYIDDLREPAGTVHLAPGHADAARGRITGIDLSAVKRAALSTASKYDWKEVAQNYLACFQKLGDGVEESS